MHRRLREAACLPGRAPCSSRLGELICGARGRMRPIRRENEDQSYLRSGPVTGVCLQALQEINAAESVKDREHGHVKHLRRRG